MSELESSVWRSDEGSGHLFLEHEPREVASYIFYKDKMVVLDPVWGRTEIGKEPGDEVLLELSKNPLVRRTMAIEQLTLDPYTETIPGTAEFSRWEHMWGGVACVRSLSEDLGLDPREKLLLQLRTFVSDLGHTAYSHLGDWLFEGTGSTEDQHDNELAYLMETSGINDVLRDNEIDPSEIIIPEATDWVECPSPDLCVDRVDYGAREIRRWLDMNVQIHYAASPEGFVVEENQLLMTSYEKALNFSKAFLILPTEHWHEPVHRLQLYLQGLLVKRILTSEDARLFASSMEAPDDFYPRDYLYSFDSDLTWEQVRTWDEFNAVVRTLMEDIGQYRRRDFVYQRKGQLQWLFSDSNRKPDLPIPLKSYGAEMHQGLPPLPLNLSITPVQKAEDMPDFGQKPDAIDILLTPLKSRCIDPLFRDADGRTFRLSQYDPNYSRLLEQQREILAQAYVARIHVSPETAQIFKSQRSVIDQRWSEALTRPRMDKQRFNAMLKESAMLAGNHRLIRIGVEDMGAFSFYPD